MLSKPSCLDFGESLFLKFFFRRIEKNRKALYEGNEDQYLGLSSVIEESIRTIRILFTEPEKNQGLRKIVNIAIKKAFSTNIQKEFNEAQIDAIMSLIPEAGFQRLAIGTHCINKDGKLFSVLGLHDIEN